MKINIWYREHTKTYYQYRYNGAVYTTYHNNKGTLIIEGEVIKYRNIQKIHS